MKDMTFKKKITDVEGDMKAEKVGQVKFRTAGGNEAFAADEGASLDEYEHEFGGDAPEEYENTCAGQA